jgi:hypothetical protein
MSYYTGAIFCALLSEAGSFHHKIGEEKASLFSLSSEGIKAEKPAISNDIAFFSIRSERNHGAEAQTPKAFSDLFPYRKEKCYIENISRKTEEHINDKKAKFGEFFKADTEEVKGDYFICGYDPMNMIKIDDMILCSHFVMLKSGSDPVFIQGPVVVNLKKGSFNEACSYVKLNDSQINQGLV